jgi:hypothetical protein
LTHGNTYIGTLAFADDIVALSYTHNGLQTMLNNAHIYATKSRFTCSIEKRRVNVLYLESLIMKTAKKYEIGLLKKIVDHWKRFK